MVFNAPPKSEAFCFWIKFILSVAFAQCLNSKRTGYECSFNNWIKLYVALNEWREIISNRRFVIDKSDGRIDMLYSGPGIPYKLHSCAWLELYNIFNE